MLVLWGWTDGGGAFSVGVVGMDGWTDGGGTTVLVLWGWTDGGGGAIQC